MVALALDTGTAPALALVLIAAVPLMALAFIAALRNPIWLLATYAAVVPFGSTLRVPGAGAFGSISTLLGLLAIATLVAHLASRSGSGMRLGVAPLFAILLLGVAVTTLLWSIDTSRTLQQAAVLAGLVALYVLVAMLPVSPTDLRRFENGVMAGGGIVGVYALYLAATGALAGVEDQRFVAAIGGGETGEAADPNITAASLVLPVAVALDRAIRPGSGQRRLLHLVVAAALVVGVILTGSRGGMLGVLAAVVILIGRNRRSWGAWIGVLVPVVAFVAAAAVAPSYVVERLTEDQRSSGRTDIWRAGLQACPEHCVLGSGWGTFAVAHQEVLFDHWETRADRLLVEAHNLWLGALVEGGIAALILVTLILLTTARGLLRSNAALRAPPLAALAGLTVTSLFLQTIAFKYFWLVLIYGVLTMNASAGLSAPPEDRRPVAATAAPEGRRQ